MTGQISFMDWIECADGMPDKSGYYWVIDRKGRQFYTWFEKLRNGFNHVHDNVGYAIERWRMI